MIKRIQVVGAVIRNEMGHILCAKRSPSNKHGGLWEFPGGKIEEGENPEIALIREIKEELGCTIEVKNFITKVEMEQSKVIIELSTYEAVMTKGTPTLYVHEEIKWLPVNDLRNLKWSPPDLPTVYQLMEGNRT